MKVWLYLKKIYQIQNILSTEYFFVSAIIIQMKAKIQKKKHRPHDSIPRK